MKIWKGLEQELDIKYPTLFIQTKTLNFTQIQKIIEISKKTNIKRLYFGAGKTEFEDFQTLSYLTKFFKEDYSIVVETCHPEKVPLIYTVIFSIELHNYDKIRPNTIIKLETKDTISTTKLDEMFTIDLNTLNKETLMYNTDELLWED